MNKAHRFLTAALIMLAIGSQAFAEADNPCGGKAMNPCGAKSGTVFHISDPMDRNSITFTSEAPLEDIVGTSRDVHGYIVFDPANPKQGGHGEIAVPVASLSSGIPLRDEHLRGAMWLDAERYPDIVLKIEKIQKIKRIKRSDDFQTYDVKIEGRLSLHGHTRKVEIPGRFTILNETEKTQQVMPGDLMAVRASFEVALDDFGITGPSGAGLIGSKVGEQIAVDVSFRGTNAEQRMVGNPCGGKATNPCGEKAMNPCGEKAMNPCSK